MDVEFNGTFFVNDKDDDNYAGFVFNYQSNKRFIIVAWKKTNETYKTRTPFISRAMSGIQIKVYHTKNSQDDTDNIILQVVNSKSGPGGKLRNALWKTGDTGNEVRTIWYDKSFAGWEYKRAYFWNMKYQADSGCMRYAINRIPTLIFNNNCLPNAQVKIPFWINQGGRYWLCV